MSSNFYIENQAIATHYVETECWKGSCFSRSEWKFQAIRQKEAHCPPADVFAIMRNVFSSLPHRNIHRNRPNINKLDGLHGESSIILDLYVGQHWNTYGACIEQ